MCNFVKAGIFKVTKITISGDDTLSGSLIKYFFLRKKYPNLVIYLPDKMSQNLMILGLLPPSQEHS